MNGMSTLKWDAFGGKVKVSVTVPAEHYECARMGHNINGFRWQPLGDMAFRLVPADGWISYVIGEYIVGTPLSHADIWTQDMSGGKSRSVVSARAGDIVRQVGYKGRTSCYTQIEPKMRFEVSEAKYKTLLADATPMRTLIVSRHPATVAWIEEFYGRLLKDGHTVVGQIDDPAMLVGNRIIGNLPMHLAAKCREYFAIEFDQTPPRGVELDHETMKKCGVHVRRYRIEEVPE